MAGSAPPPGFEESPITYEQLGELEKEFEDVETEIMRHQVQLSRPLYQKRHEMVSQIANFWPLVFEQAPPDIDEYIQPSDASLLLSSLVSLTVRHFELEGDDNINNDSSSPSTATVTTTQNTTEDGDPRSIAIRFEFAENEHFTDKVLEKRFTHRRTRGGWSGLVSEPVDIHWRSREKDLTDGLLGLVNRVWQLERDENNNNDTTTKEKKESKALQEIKETLRKRVESTPLGGLSFFAWFGYRGRPVSAEEHELAMERERKRRAGETLEPLPQGVEEDNDDQDNWEEEYEIFPTGDDLAIAITEDLWPGALKYFTQAQEQDAMSDDDFESDDDDEDDEGNEVNGEEARPSKKRKA